MKKVLFIGVTKYNFEKFHTLAHLESKFLGLSQHFEVFNLDRGRPFHKKIWNSEFYLFPEGIFYWPLAFLISFYLCLFKKINVVVAQSPLMEGFLGSLLKFFFNVELVVEMHGDWIEGPFLSKKRRFEKIERKIVPFLARTSLKNADKIRGVAEYLIERAKKTAPLKKYYLFPTFTNLDIFLDEKEKSFNDFILSVGQLEKVKGLDYLIEAFAIIAKDFSDFKLVIIGEGSERSVLEEKIRKLQLKEKIELKGRLSLQETKDNMKNCYCFILPSLSEGLPRVLLEAMALEKPVIASRVGGIPDIVRKDSGFLVEKTNVNDLAQKIKLLLDDKILATTMGKKGRAFVKERFSNKQYIQNFAKMIYE